jgi:L-asparaginase
MPSHARTVVVLGTGGTIAGSAASASDDLGYRSGVVAVGALVEGLANPDAVAVESEQVAQLDSKDMDFPTWRRLAERVSHHLARGDVAGVVVTHGTDTLEETAYFLQRVLAPGKPVVLTAAMRPASSRQADGPQNLADAVAIALQAEAAGVVAVLAGVVHSAFDVRKTQPYRLDAFASGDAGPLAHVEAGRLRRLRPWPHGEAIGLAALPADAAAWPFVSIVTSTAGADARQVEALVGAGCAGIVVAATGNGTLHHALDTSLRRAALGGVAVLRSTRCLDGPIVENPALGADILPCAGALTPPKARVELILRLLAARSPAT